MKIVNFVYKHLQSYLSHIGVDAAKSVYNLNLKE